MFLLLFVRLGISPDCCLAYIDFLYNSNRVEPAAAPLCKPGQPKLPIAFRFAGIGTYFTPWVLDTNDFLLQVFILIPLKSVTLAKCLNICPFPACVRNIVCQPISLNMCPRHETHDQTTQRSSLAGCASNDAHEQVHRQGMDPVCGRAEQPAAHNSA